MHRAGIYACCATARHDAPQLWEFANELVASRSSTLEGFRCGSSKLAQEQVWCRDVLRGWLSLYAFWDTGAYHCRERVLSVVSSALYVARERGCATPRAMVSCEEVDGVHHGVDDGGMLDDPSRSKGRVGTVGERRGDAIYTFVFSPKCCLCSSCS